MAGEEVEVAARLRRRLEEEYGVQETAYLMDRPAGGWDSLATKEYIDLRFAVVDARFESLERQLRADFRQQTTRLLLWIVPTIFTGVAALGAIVAAAS